jgi:hypothetical protein
MIDFLSNHGVVVRKEERRFADEHSIQRQHRKSGTKMQNQNTSKSVFLYVNNIEILCDDEEFVYDKERLLPILFTRQLKKTVINPIIFSK